MAEQFAQHIFVVFRIACRAAIDEAVNVRCRAAEFEGRPRDRPSADRKVRSTAYQLKAAGFPNSCDLAGFDFAWQAKSTRRSHIRGSSRPAALARLGRRHGSERRRDVDDGRSLAFETRQRQRPHVLSRPEPPSEIGRVNRPAGVGDDEHMIAEVGGVPRGGFERMGREAAA